MSHTKRHNALGGMRLRTGLVKIARYPEIVCSETPTHP